MFHSRFEVVANETDPEVAVDWAGSGVIRFVGEVTVVPVAENVKSANVRAVRPNLVRDCHSV